MIYRTTDILRWLAWPQLRTVATLLVLLLGTACSGTSTAQNSTAISSGDAAAMPLGMSMTAAPDNATTVGANQVTIQNFNFGPGVLTISAGTTVTWTNNDSVTHTVTAMDGSFDSSNLKPGQQFSFKFDTPGTYNYHCTIHPFMTGQVVVQ